MTNTVNILLKRCLYITHRIFLNNSKVKKGGADYIIDYFKHKYVIYNLDLKLNQYSLFEPNKDILCLKILYKNKSRIIFVKKFKHQNYFIKFILEFFFVNYLIIKLNKTFSSIITVNPINTIYIIFLKKLNLFNKSYFHFIDYSEKRFESSILNFIYKKFISLNCLSSDYVGYVSKKMRELPYFNNNFLFIPNSPLFFKKSLSKKKLYDLIILSPKFDDQTDWKKLSFYLSQLKKHKADFKILITGEKKGFLYESFKRDVLRFNLKKNIIFSGYIHNNYEKQKLISSSKIGLTFYKYSNLTNYSEFADSLKIREYAAYGLPMLTEGLFFNSFEAKNKRCCYIYNNLYQFVAYFDILINNHYIFLKMSIRSDKWNKENSKIKILKKLDENLFN